MSILNKIQLESNSKIKVNFDAGNLSSDSGLLLIKEFVHKLDFYNTIKKIFKTKDKASRTHKDDENLCQLIYQILQGTSMIMTQMIC